MVSARPQGVDRAARLERRRRVLHLRRRRRDLLEDSVAALVLMIVAVIITPGLGMLAILEVPVALALIGTVVAERRIRRRRYPAARGAPRPAVPERTARRPSRR